MPQIIVSVAPDGYITSVKRVESFDLSDAVALFPPFTVGERALGASLLPSVRNSPYLTAEEKHAAVEQLTLFAPGARIVGVAVPAPLLTTGEPVGPASLPVIITRGGGIAVFKLNPGLIQIVDP